MGFDRDPVAVPTNIAGILTIMHQTVEVIWKSKVVGIMFVKVLLVIRMNVIPDNLDIIVSVHTSLGVEEAYSMEKLVLYDSGAECDIPVPGILGIFNFFAGIRTGIREIWYQN